MEKSRKQENENSNIKKENLKVKEDLSKAKSYIDSLLRI
jgi:hypothetical protein